MECEHKDEDKEIKLIPLRQNIIILFQLVIYRHQFHGFKTCLLGRDFYTLMKNVLFFSPTDL